MLNKPTYFITISLLLIVGSLISQSEYLVGHIGLKDGLSSQLCSHLLEDDNGNLWISTYQDVQKYNGYSATIFSQPSPSKNDESIANLLKDARGNIWVVRGKTDFDIDPFNLNSFLVNGSIHIIHATTDSIYSIEDYLGKHKYGKLDIVKILSNGTSLFICTSDNRIFTYASSLELYTTLKDIKKMVTVTATGDIVYLDKDGLISFDSSNNSKLMLPSKSLEQYDGLITSQNGELFFIATHSDSVSIHEYKDSQMHYLSTFEKELFSHSASRPNKIERYGQNLILVWNRLFELQEGGKAKELKLAKTKRLISEYVVGKSGLGFAATDLGIYILNTKRNRFQQLASNNDSLNSVRAFYKSPDISLYKEGIEKISRHSKKYNLQFLADYNLGYLAYHHYQDPINQDHIWTVGHLDDCLIRRINLKTEKIECMEIIPENVYTTHHIFRSEKNKILYISNSGRPYYFDESIQKFRHLVLDCIGDKSILTTHIIEKNGQIWFASSDGVIQYNEDSKTCNLKKIFPQTASYIIQHIHEDKSDPKIIWLGTRRGGLAKWNTATDSIQIFNTDHGLSNDDVHAILEDNSERLWIPTNKYLNTFDKKTNSFFHFTEADGLSHSEFNKFSFFHDTQLGQMYFGGLNGYNYFNPDSITTKHNDYIKLRIIDVSKINREGKTENFYDETLETSSITILEQDVSIQIELATNYLLNPTATKYSYRIPGLLDEWKTEATNVIGLNRLPYGEYTLELKADMNKSSSMSDILRINLNVDLPWWKTIPFYIFTILSALALIGFTVKIYNRRIIERNIKLEEMVSLRTQELQEVVKTKNKIFTILAHDLRNPISGLSNISSKVRFLLSKNRFSDLNLIALETEKRVKALNDNLNNILLWAMSENKTLTVRPRQISMNSELEKVLQLYAYEIKHKKLIINKETEIEDMVFLDLTILQTLLRNFIHNSIKFSHDKGTINIFLSNKDQKKLELKIEDFGIGMESLNDNETQDINSHIRNKEKGTGLGIKISKELADKANVEFKIDSKIGRGTTILLTFPKGD